MHYWAVWHGNKPFFRIQEVFLPVCLRVWLQAFPSLKTIETFTDDPEDYNAFSYICESISASTAPTVKIMGYMQQTYKYPSGFDTFIYASQLLQADAIRYGVEHFRRNRGRCMEPYTGSSMTAGRWYPGRVSIMKAG